MNRRAFTTKVTFGSLVISSLLSSKAYTQTEQRIFPKRLQKGDTLGLITPGSYIPDKALEKAISNLKTLGFKIRLGKNIRAKRGFNAGTDAERLEDLHAMFADPAIAGIWCARGGYGCSRILPQIDYDLIKKNPKVILGYSDITALLQAIYLKTGLVGFHGPVGASEMTDYTRENLWPLLVDAKAKHHIKLAEENKNKDNKAYQTKVLQAGKSEGILIGGNLSLLAALAGTAYAIDATDKIVFMEDIGEKPYRIDRMLTQLRQTANLDKAAGIALGIFADCESDGKAPSLSLEETLRDRLGDLGVPVIYGLSFGHIDNMCTIPVGAKASLDTEKQLLSIEEAVVR